MKRSLLFSYLRRRWVSGAGLLESQRHQSSPVEAAAGALPSFSTFSKIGKQTARQHKHSTSQHQHQHQHQPVCDVSPTHAHAVLLARERSVPVHANVRANDHAAGHDAAQSLGQRFPGPSARVCEYGQNAAPHAPARHEFVSAD